MKWIFDLIMSITYATSVDLEARDSEIGVIDNFDDLITYQRREARAWKYVYDKWLGIRNNISAPPKAVNEFSGDCDDFASKMYQAGQKFNPTLLTYFPRAITKAHTITVLRPTEGRYKDWYIVMNWGRTKYLTSMQQVKNYCETYADSKIMSFHWAKYNYETGRFEGIKESEV